MKRILVTGGSGFLGSHLCQRLHAQGHYIICLDNNYTGSEKNITPLIGKKNFEFINHDVTQPIDVKCDEIYNLACPASPVHYQTKPIFTIETSYMGAKNMLDLAVKNKAKILQASTSEVYGDPEVHPQKESYWGHVNPIGPRACYDEGKRIAETLFVNYQKAYDLEIKIMRIFNTYGPNMHPQDGRVVSNFIVQALAGKNITIYGDGKQTRSFCYVDDNINGMIALMNSPKDITGPINIGNPHEFTMLELAEIVLKMTNSKSKIIFEALPVDDPMQRKPDISLAKTHLNWEPKIPLKDGLVKTTEYFKSIL
ncbi:MAG: SDR family oxidoreductase [Bacteriovoracaceae bacterium]|nr:SDR family oxidoreductase [Bacteriovoracaceae bacterium]